MHLNIELDVFEYLRTKKETICARTVRSRQRVRSLWPPHEKSRQMTKTGKVQTDTLMWGTYYERYKTMSETIWTKMWWMKSLCLLLFLISGFLLCPFPFIVLSYSYMMLTCALFSHLVPVQSSLESTMTETVVLYAICINAISNSLSINNSHKSHGLSKPLPSASIHFSDWSGRPVCCNWSADCIAYKKPNTHYNN